MDRGTSLLGGGSSRALLTLCKRALSSADFRSALRAPLRALLDFDGYCVNTCDVTTGVVTSSVGDGLSPEQARTLFALEAEGTDFNTLRELHRGPKRIASLWHSTRGQLERSPRMRELFLPLGFRDELRAALTVDGACFGYLHLLRHAALGPFQPAELKRLAALVAPIATALRRAVLANAARSNDDAPPSESPSLLVLDAHNRLVRHSEGAPAVVSGLDDLRVASGPAHLLQDLVSRARVAGSCRTTLVRASGEPRSLSALRLGDQTAVVIERLKAEDGQALLATSAGLTPRERKVSACIARGDANRAIAAELGISLHTVKDHVKATLLKTRCASRAELAARWNGARLPRVRLPP